MTPPDPENFTQRLIPVALSFTACVSMLCYLTGVPTRIWAPSIVLACGSAYFGPPLLMAWLLSDGTRGWIPLNGSVEGLLGLFLGFAAMFLVGAFVKHGRRFENDPAGFVRNRGNE